ncbi:MAG TPA: hypothetical protein VHK05_00485 [Candidatus Limnocylindrales bacterium]|jgi:hypothetical protein|nr:hypothetical protein [Candidatus Limnocylindrales bacterium]
MPVRDRQPEPVDPVTLHPVVLVRPGGVEDGSAATSPGVLLSPGALLPPAPVPAPARALALDALRVVRALRDPARRPARWAQPSFGAEVELVRRHLAPVRSRQTLAASYGREAFHLVISRGERDDPSPIRLAYALRWMELRDGATGPSWQTLLS